MEEIKKIEICAGRLESVLFELECGLNALDAIYAAMAEAPNDPGDYVDALYCVHDYLRERERAVKAIVCDIHGSKVTGAGGAA